ncbi:MAG TPA: M23 family metallopeptidase, partial [Thermomicrobiales bacterium]|nr:M23 family metallopeptidase [Thermomicrobiales bacterium]
ALAREFGVDPLLIVVWQVESQMDTVGLNVPGNGGNMIWDAMAPYAARWSCAPGPSSLGHHWGACPSITAGLGIWFEYVGTSPVYAGAADLAAFADVYNPCSDPANAANGFPCGAAYADLLLGLLRTYAGPPAVSAGGGPGFQAIWGGGDEPITQEFGRTGFSDGNPIYGYGAAYGLPAGVHPGVDVGLPAGTPLYSPVDGVIVIAGGSGYYRDEDEAVDPATSGELRIRRPNGDLIILGHLRRIDVRVGQAVRTGQPVGLSGSANGPHVHVEVRVVDASLPSGYRIVNPRPYLDGAGR